jgi:hypothetical protein
MNFAIDQFLSTVSDIQVPERPRSPPCNSLSASILSAPIPHTQKENLQWNLPSTVKPLKPTEQQLTQQLATLRSEFEMFKAFIHEKYTNHSTCISELQTQVFQSNNKRKHENSDNQYSLVNEVKIKEAIGQFLKSWNKNYRCSHNYRETCKFKEDKCFRIHENVKHAIIAKELRAILQAKGDLTVSPFFTNIRDKIIRQQFNCQNVLQAMHMEMVELSATI